MQGPRASERAIDEIRNYVLRRKGYVDARQVEHGARIQWETSVMFYLSYRRYATQLVLKEWTVT